MFGIDAGLRAKRYAAFTSSSSSARVPAVFFPPLFATPRLS
jgi:hypothetical protein